MKTYIDLPEDLHGIIINYIDKDDLLKLRSVCKETRKIVANVGTFLFKIETLEKFKQITEKNNNDKIFRKVIFDLNLYRSGLNEEELNYLVKELIHNSSLQELNLGFNEIDDNEAKSLAEALKVNNSLQELGFFHNGIGTDGVKDFAEALKMNSSLKKLNFSFNFNIIGSVGVKNLAEALKVNNSLQELDIYGLCNEVNEILSNVTKHKEGFKLNF